MEITSRQALSIGLLVLIVIAMICGYVPWDSIKFADGTTAKTLVNLPFTTLAKVPVLGNLLGAEHYTQFGDWYFEEFSFVFLAGALLLGIINKIPEATFIKEFIAGARDLLSVVLVLAIANGISVIMGSKTAGMSVTFVYWIQNALQGRAFLGFLPGRHPVLCGHRVLHAVHQRGSRDHHAHPGGRGLCPV